MLLCVLAAAEASAQGDVLRKNGPFRLIESDRSGVTIEYEARAPVLSDQETPFGLFQSIRIEAHGNLLDLGRPSLPTAGVGLAIPEGMDARLSWDVLESSERTGVRPLPAFEGPIPEGEAGITRRDGAALDEALYGGTAAWPDRQITFQDAGRLRHHRVGQLSVTPVRWEPATDRITVISKARIRVDFVASRDAAVKSAASRSIPVGEERAWEDTYRNTFLNYEAARAFRARPFPGAAPAPRSSGSLDRGLPPPGFDRSLDTRSFAGANPEFRIYVAKTGLYYVTPADLSPHGWPADVPIDQISFYEKAYNADDPANPLIREIPIQVEEGGTPDGLFNGEDYFYFYGLNFVDRFRPPFETERYTRMHVYWLSYSDEGTARMAASPGWYEAELFTAPQSYVHATHWEEELRYIFIRPVIGGYELFPSLDTHYWLDASSYRDSLVFSSPGRDATRPMRIRATWQGVFLGTHYVSIWLTRGHQGVTNDTLLLNRQPFMPSQTYTYNSGFTIPGARVVDGDNRLKLQGNGFAPGDPNSQGSGAYFDGFDVDYHRYYVVHNGTLRFTSGQATGDVEFTIRGLTDNNLVMFDITDSLAPARVTIEPSQITQISGPPRREYELSFRANVSAQRTYLLHTLAAIPPIAQAVEPGKMPPDLGTSIIQADVAADVVSDRGADVIVLAHPSMQAALGPWTERRSDPPYNHDVWVVSPQDVWDTFSGGHKNVAALRTWLRQAYRNWATPPDYLFLFGDGNEDYRKLLGSADGDWVPTMMIYAPVNGPDSRLELAGSDNWFVGSLAAGDLETNVFPDMHVGRYSPDTPAEAQALVDKLMLYDTYSPEDAWRNRGLIVSDDRYSTPITSAGRYDFSPTERLFVDGADSLKSIFANQSCYTNFVCEEYRLEEVLAGAPCNLGRTYQIGNFPDLGVTIDCAKRYGAPSWVEVSSKGHLFQIYSGHGNRFVMATERFVEFNGGFASSDYRTPELLANYGKPFVYFGVGCHLNEFENFQEFETEASLGEKMVLLPNRGAIASMASTAYEWLSTNLWVEVYSGKVMFSDHPVDPAEGPRRILGEGVDQALVRMALEKGGGPDNNNIYRDCLKTYGLLGDPTMRVDMAPPELLVTVDGEPFTSGESVRPAPGATSVAIRARVSDDVNYSTDNFSIEANGVTLPREAYTLTPVDDNLDGACRGLIVEYTAALDAGLFPIVLRATDWIGREMTFTLQLNVGVTFLANGRELHTGDLVPVDAPIEVVIDSPNPLTPSDIMILLNGEDGTFSLAGEAGDWTATTVGNLPEGPLRIEAVVRGDVLKSLDVEARNDVHFTEVYFYPSPWEGGEDGRFTYQLAYPSSEAPKSVSVTVYTVSGRKVITLDGPTSTGRNAIAWNMRDASGDGISNGVYLFRMVFETESGQKLTHTDKLVVHQ